MPTSRDKESGFALLLVFLMAAVIAIALYSEIPRVAFQSQRQKEQLLVERGEQYRRAVQVFYQANRMWPRNLEDLEKYQNRRFLRHKYIDPMTGEPEWRIIHVGPSGIPTDSALAKEAEQPASSGDSSYITAYAGIGQQTQGAQQSMRPQDRRRASEGGAEDEPPPESVSADASQPADNPSPGENPSTQTPGAPGAPPGALAAIMQSQGAQQQQQGAEGASATPPPGDVSQTQGSNYITSMPGIGAQAPGNPSIPGNAQGAGSVVPAVPQGQNPATQMIQNMLTRPNPQAARMIQQQAAAASSGAPGSAATSNSPGAGGVGGVASKSTLEGIMVYNDRTAYNEWEFLFNPATAVQTPAAAGGSGTGSATGGPDLRSWTGSSGNQSNTGGQSPRSATGITSAFGGSSTPARGSAPNSGQSGSGTAGMQTTGAGNAQLPTIRMGRP